MKTLTFKYDLYGLYERVLEGVEVNITVEYDLDMILAAKDFTSEVVKITDIQFDSSGLHYVDSLPFDKDQILSEVKEYFDEDINGLVEYFVEALPQDEYDLVEAIF